jgi:hypothetical protein
MDGQRLSYLLPGAEKRSKRMDFALVSMFAVGLLLQLSAAGKLYPHFQRTQPQYEH